ncbi:MAG TPA: response regulator [Patescibacteria group bacterium]|nr:response regulator [Patescibacteria group bacterium]
MNTARILVVDDEPRNIRLLESLLARDDYQVLKATDGQEACRRIIEDNPDLVLLDAMMPQMNGFEVCSWIRGRAATALMPVVMVTALNSTEEKVHALETGADDFLSKPINRMELTAKVKALLRVRSLQEALARKNEELRRAEALRESLVQMIVHDLKNPLTGIQAAIDLMIESHLGPNPGAMRLAGSVRLSCHSMMEMILNMLDIGRMEDNVCVLEAADHDLSGVIARDVEECLGMARAAGVEIVVECPTPAPRVRVDRGLVQRVIANLLNNAVKHTPAGGRVTISTRPVGDQPQGDRIEVRVGDTGEGIPAAEAERIFEKFARVAGQRGATRQDRGLGLTFCRMAVEAHGGRIRVESEPGRGSVFIFTLPASAPAATAATTSPSATPATASEHA